MHCRETVICSANASALPQNCNGVNERQRTSEQRDALSDRERFTENH